MRLGDILKTIKTGEKIKIEYWRGKKLYQKTFNFNLFKLKIEKKYPIYEKEPVDYEIIGGMIVMELTNNHLEIIMEDLESDFSKNNRLNKKFTNLLKYMSHENKKETKLIITHIFPNSYLRNFEILNEYDIIDTVNNKKCMTLNDFRKNIKITKKIGNKQFITLKTEINNSIVLVVDDFLKEEKTFAETYKYNLSELYKYFQKNKKVFSVKLTQKNQKNKRKRKSKKKINQNNKL